MKPNLKLGDFIEIDIIEGNAKFRKTCEVVETFQAYNSILINTKELDYSLVLDDTIELI